MPTKQALRCPICLGYDLDLFLERDQVPVFQNVLFNSRAQALNVERGALKLMACVSCGFVFNAAFDAAKAQYGQQYDNDQTRSAEFADYLDGHIRRLVQDRAVRDCTIVEVGCGNGWFLERLVSASPTCSGVGFDPAYRGPDQLLDGRIRFARRYFLPEDAALHADVVVCRHVIEHVADPVALLTSVRQALGQSRQPRVFFETPCVEWILRNQVIWDFFYEHCSYFSAQSMKTAFSRAGFEVERVEHVFGGQYLWLEATAARGEGAYETDARDVPALAKAFGQAEPRLRERWNSDVQSLLRRGKAAVWGAGAKGVTFLNIVDPAASLIDCAVDISRSKQGRFIGGTGHLVVGVEQLPQRGVASVLLMNPNYRLENERLLAAAHCEVELVG